MLAEWTGELLCLSLSSSWLAPGEFHVRLPVQKVHCVSSFPVPYPPNLPCKLCGTQAVRAGFIKMLDDHHFSTVSSQDKFKDAEGSAQTCV